MYDKYNMVVKELKGIFNELEIPLDDSLTDLQQHINEFEIPLDDSLTDLPQHRWDKSLNIEYLLLKFMDDTENIESVHHLFSI